MLVHFLVASVAALCASPFVLFGIAPPTLWYLLVWGTTVMVSRSLSNYFYIYRISRRASLFGARLAPFTAISGLPINYFFVKNLRRLDPGDLLIGIEPRLSGEIQAKKTSKVFNTAARGTYSILTKDPQMIKQIFSMEKFTNFGRGDVFKLAFKDLLGSGVFTTDHDQLWKQHRNLMKPFFSKERVRNVNLNRIDKTIKVFSNHAQSNDPVDVYDNVSRMMFDTALEYFYGFSFHELSNESLLNYMNLFDTGVNNAVLKLIGVFGHILEFIPKFSVNRCTKDLAPLIDQIVENAIENRANFLNKDVDRSSAKEHDNFLDYLITQSDNRNVIFGAIMNILFAARDTTTSLITATLYQFAENPEMFDKTREEIIRLCGNDTVLNQDTLRQCKLLHVCLKETLRMYPSAPMLERYCFEDSVLSTMDNERFFVPQGTTISISIWLLHRDKALWGEDADKWDPYRWLDSRHEIVKGNPSIYIPFSQGPHICLGQDQALHLASLFLVRFCQAFEKVDRATDVQNTVLPTSSTTLQWKTGIWLRLRMTSAS